MGADKKPKIGALVVSAIRRLQDAQGSTSREISNYISQEYDIPDQDIKKQVRLALERGVSYGILQRSNRGCYTCNRDFLDKQPMENDRFKEACKSRRRRRRSRAGCKRRSRRRKRRSRRGAACRRRSQKSGMRRRRSRRSGKSRRRRGKRRRRRTRRRRCDTIEVDRIPKELMISGEEGEPVQSNDSHSGASSISNNSINSNDIQRESTPTIPPANDRY